jgi:hypothetical protein
MEPLHPFFCSLDVRFLQVLVSRDRIQLITCTAFSTFPGVMYTAICLLLGLKSPVQGARYFIHCPVIDGLTNVSQCLVIPPFLGYYLPGVESNSSDFDPIYHLPASNSRGSSSSHCHYILLNSTYITSGSFVWYDHWLWMGLWTFKVLSTSREDSAMDRGKTEATSQIAKFVC